VKNFLISFVLFFHEFHVAASHFMISMQRLHLYFPVCMAFHDGDFYGYGSFVIWVLVLFIWAACLKESSFSLLALFFSLLFSDQQMDGLIFWEKYPLSFCYFF